MELKKELCIIQTFFCPFSSAFGQKRTTSKDFNLASMWQQGRDAKEKKDKNSNSFLPCCIIFMSKCQRTDYRGEG